MTQRLCKGDKDKNARILFQEEDCTAYKIQNEDGELSVTEYYVFPGIWLIYKEAHASKYVYPPSYPSGLLEITHCREGRVEYEGDNQFYYLLKGDMSVTRSRGEQMEIYCPTQRYQGITVMIDAKSAPDCLSCFMEDVKVRPEMLMQKFCQNNQSFIMRSTSQIEHIFSELYSVPDEIKKGYFKVKVLELLLFLSTLEPKFSQTEEHKFSKAQAELAKHVCRFMEENIHTRFTIEQLAERFYVSSSQIKKSFYCVYGESVYAHIRTYKMKSAAHRLAKEKTSISEIAESFGYENSSKFAKAFRDVMGVSPTEYRWQSYDRDGDKNA